MNDKRRKRIREVVARLESCSTDLESIKDEEDETRDNIPENLQNGDRYCESEECSDKIDDAISDIRSAIDGLGEIE